MNNSENNWVLIAGWSVEVDLYEQNEVYTIVVALNPGRIEPW